MDIIGKIVTVFIDRPLGTYQPQHKDIYYTVNYGYIPGIFAADGEEQDVYVLGIDTPIKELTGKVIAVIHRKNDVESKWVVAPENKSFTKEEIAEAVYFQEKYFDIEITDLNEKRWNMKIIFVRHGHPDYEKDCLTELGHLHAEAVAERLKDEPIQRIYSSTCGRAYETALHICEKKGLPLTKAFDFMRELDWGPLTGTAHWEVYSPWRLSEEMVRNQEPMLSPDWVKQKDFSQSKVIGEVEKVAKGFDAFLETLGYVREGAYYRAQKTNDETIVMVSHGGSSCAAIGHLFNLAFPFMCNVFRWDFTGICEVTLQGAVGELITPRWGLVNDSRHIEGVTI